MAKHINQKRSTGEVHTLLSDVEGRDLLARHELEMRTHNRGAVRGNVPISLHSTNERRLLGQLTFRKDGALEVRHSDRERRLTEFGNEVARRLKTTAVHAP